MFSERTRRTGGREAKGGKHLGADQQEVTYLYMRRMAKDFKNKKKKQNVEIGSGKEEGRCRPVVKTSAAAPKERHGSKNHTKKKMGDVKATPAKKSRQNIIVPGSKNV